MTATRSLALGLFAATLATAAFAQSGPAQLSIQLDKPLHPVSPMLYGLMTEEINYSYDGGLYAEMVRNRTFQDHGFGGLASWNLDNKGTARGTMHYDGTEGPSEALPGSMRLEIASADAANTAGVRNEGWWGMALQPDTTYKGSLYAKADADNFGPITVSLVNDNTGAILATATVGSATTAWKQYEFTLKTAKLTPSSTNHLLISAGHTGKLWLDLISLFPPTYKNRENGNRPDLMEMMAAMHSKFLRMPGGNYLEGDEIDERFDWKTTLGPLVDRPTHRSPWNYQSSDGMGLLEFLEWTEDLKIEPVLAVFAGYALKHDYIHPGPALTPYVDDALDELEFVTGDTSTKWGAVRAKLGHPQPFPLHYVEIGNEDWFDRSGSYEGRYAQFYKAIKAKYPQLQLIATMPLKRMKPDVQDDHYYKNADEFFNFVKHYDDADRNGPKIFVGEWATREGSPTTNLGAALGDAAWMTAMERNSDLIVMSSYAPLFVNVNPGGMQWQSDLIGYDASSAYGSPGYYAQVLFGQHLGTSVPASSIANAGDRLFYSITNDPAKGVAYLKLVNATSTPQPIETAITGATPGSTATVYTLTGHTTAETNSITDPKRIVPVKSTIKTGAKFSHTIPPYSIQVVVMETK
ncbi:MAG: alpha-L-arabinofuranosidase C-terminal domain-containing protein [Edaphobacter sp.]|uniref:alpha-L-arabinofuranosidase C-terminal domain-containing protein n=1 Tax=Edaphobacter sp. TaxID=1934404 RepID=UPI0023A09299|nr:alpha-L-arabinofuranosidase C-terminal domain-containing protein [Edaphobacter sp.]MDE1176824.1 alpha-L-arabinofuranosidase C-terminal domain-containing protein [Edaphobacter sp.]